ncbi:MAG: hypothetical protein AB7F28_01730 [Candidatus Margulisiibacteriota bacterium]
MVLSQRNKSLLDGLFAGELSHAYVLSGPWGSFLADAATHVAQRVFCQHETEKPCGLCHGCLSIAKETNPDFFRVQPEGKIAIATVRNIQERVRFGPTYAKHLLCIIHDADQMTTEAANAFLKTLEEPPQGVCFMLLTHQRFSLLPTIRSRVQEVVLNPAHAEDWLPVLGTVPVLQGFYESHPNATELIAYLLETNTEPDFPAVPYAEFLTWSLNQRLELAGQLATDKQKATLFLMLWLYDFKHLQGMNRTQTRNMDLIIENISQMTYNLNLRLHLEQLFIGL